MGLTKKIAEIVTKKHIFIYLQVIVTILLMLLVAYQVGLFHEQGRKEFTDLIRRADLWLLLLSVFAGILVILSSALKWFMLARAQHLSVGYWRTFSYYLVGQFYNLILPTSVGGDVVRSYEMGKFTGQQAKTMASVFVERYTGVLVLLLLAFFAVVAKLSTFNTYYVIYSLIAFALGLGLMAWLILDRRLYAWVQTWFSQRLPFTRNIFVKVESLLDSIHDYRNQPHALVWAFVNSFVFYFLAVVNIYVSALVFELNIDFIDILIATPIIMLIMNIPLSIGNLGLMEFAYAAIFQLMGYSPMLGLSVAILMRLKSLFEGAMGGVLYPFYVTRK